MGGNSTPLSEETKRLVSLHHSKYWRGKRHTEASKRKMSIAKRGNVPTAKKVMCVEKNVVYISTYDVEQQTGIPHSNVSACCLGKRKTAGGYHWKYIIDVERG